ncbi:MAG: glycosyltransferase family 4 protein [Deltaproteobacteria bacterium]|nr:glycosyltransferase family 4 protein [Deltaproteobacteria bacterium]
MKIALDARMITYTGIGRYIQNLIANLPVIAKDHQFSILLNNEEIDLKDLRNISYNKLTRNIPVYSIGEQIRLPVAMNGSKPDLLHYPSFNIPVVNLKPVVTTIHDLIYYVMPEACPNKIAHYYARFMLNMAAKRSDSIITVSIYTKNDIVKHLGVSPDKIKVIYHGVDEIYRPVKDAKTLEAVRKRYGIDGDYIFYAGNHQPRKNLRRLIEAFSILKNRKDCRLVLTGKIDPRRAELYNSVKELGLDGRVLFIGPVPEEELPALYSMARMFVFPSLYEGFGLPPLEAMACGTPVITSNTTSLPEVVGNAGITIDPLNTKELAESMESILSSSSLRQELKEKGLKRAAEFSWERTARETLKVYEEVMNL